jgi:citrate lyase subunit beta/citryl-CoA lyase
MPMPTPPPRRSALYLPASNARAIVKARDLPCDIVILDLEDAVAPDAKAAARQQAVEAVAAGGFGAREVVIRVNALATPWGAADLEAAAAARPSAILAPKVSSGADAEAYAAPLRGETQLWAMIETGAALLRLEGIAQTAALGRLTTWVMGTNDLAKELRCSLEEDRGPLLGLLSLAVVAARAYGLSILDGVYNALSDDAGLERQCRQGVAFGFDGKTLIHPRQIAIANRVFSPAPEAIAWARTVVDAFALAENAEKGVLQIDGRMVERLHLEQARQLLGQAAAIGG